MKYIKGLMYIAIALTNYDIAFKKIKPETISDYFRHVQINYSLLPLNDRKRK